MTIYVQILAVVTMCANISLNVAKNKNRSGANRSSKVVYLEK